MASSASGLVQSLRSSAGVHNLREIAWEDTAYDWALAFDERMKGMILSADHEAKIGYSKLG